MNKDIFRIFQSLWNPIKNYSIVKREIVEKKNKDFHF